MVVPPALRENWPVLRLVMERVVMADRVDELSINDVADLNEALDVWAQAKGG